MAEVFPDFYGLCILLSRLQALTLIMMLDLVGLNGMRWNTGQWPKIGRRTEARRKWTAPRVLNQTKRIVALNMGSRQEALGGKRGGDSSGLLLILVVGNYFPAPTAGKQRVRQQFSAAIRTGIDHGQVPD
jgi:hypothetical protein